MTTTVKEMNFLDRILDKLCLSPLGALALILLFLIPTFVTQEYLLRWFTMAIFIAASAIAFDLSVGYINIVNFGFNAIVGLGGYTSAILAANLGLSPWIGMFIGAGSAAIIGFGVGLLTLRHRGIFAALVTWFIGLAIMGIAQKWVGLTRGMLGLRAPQLFDTPSNVPYYYMILTMMVLIYIICRWTVRSNMGLAFRAIGQNMEAARTSGISPTYYRIFNFTLSCALAGWLGGFYAHYMGILTPDFMHTSKTVEVLAVAYIGGRGTLWGGPFIAIPFLISMELIRSGFTNLPGIHLVIYGLFLILVMIYLPGGVASIYLNLAAKVKNNFLRWFLGQKDDV